MKGNGPDWIISGHLLLKFAEAPLRFATQCNDFEASTDGVQDQSTKQVSRMAWVLILKICGAHVRLEALSSSSESVARLCLTLPGLKSDFEV